MSSRVAAPLLAGVGVLLVAAAVLPLLLAKKETADATPGDGLAAWQSEGSDPGSTTPPLWNGASPGSVATAASPQQRSAGEPGVFLGTRAPSAVTTPVNPAASEPQTVQVRASSWEDPSQASAGRPGEEITSWRDAGQWPYGNGVGQPTSASLAADPYPQTGQAAAAYELPAGVQGTPIPYASASPEIGMNRPMALSGPESARAAGHSIAAPQSRQPPAGVYGGGSAPGIYSADARNTSRPQPTAAYPNTSRSVSPGAYPGAATPSPSYGGGYPIPETGAGMQIPGASNAPSYSQGYGAGPQGAGVARLQGVIEKPSVRTTYDYNRPGVH